MDKKQAGSFAENISEHLSDHFSDALGKGFKEALEKMESQEDVQAMKATAKEVADTATEFIRKYPLQSVVGAAVIGFALGSLLNKRK